MVNTITARSSATSGRALSPRARNLRSVSTALLADQEVIRHSIELRNPYVDPLNYLQVDTLRKLRALSESVRP